MPQPFDYNVQPVNALGAYRSGVEQRQADDKQNALQQYLPKALQGDQQAAGQIAAVDPDMGMKLTQWAQSLGDRERKAAADDAVAFTGAFQGYDPKNQQELQPRLQAAAASMSAKGRETLMSLPPDQIPAALQRASYMPSAIAAASEQRQRDDQHQTATHAIQSSDRSFAETVRHNRVSEAADQQKIAAAKTIDPTYLRGVVNYETELPSPRDPKYIPTLAAAREMDPTFDPSHRQQINRTRQAFITGEGGKTMNRVNTAVQHLDLLRSAAAALENKQDPRTISWLKNEWRREFGSEVPTNFEAIARTAAGEVAVAILPGGGTGEERGEFGKEFSTAASQNQLSGAITSRIGLMGGKIDGSRQQYISAFPKTQRARAAKEFDERFMLPHTAEVIHQANGQLGIGEANTPTRPKPGTVKDGYRYMGGDPSLQSSWKKQ